MSKTSKPLPNWDETLTVASRIQTILPETALFGGCAAVHYVGHRVSYGVDYAMKGLDYNYYEILSQLDSIAGWKRIWTKPRQAILGSLDGIKVSVRRLSRTEPLETFSFEYKGIQIVLLTEAELIKSKSVAILFRSVVRDYLDLAALVEHSGPEKSIKALNDLDRARHMENDQSALRILQTKISNPAPEDIKKINFKNYKKLIPKWRTWEYTVRVLKRLAMDLSESTRDKSTPRPSGPRP
ncbi:MAG: hypothetical protein LBO66_10775 [Deltaproteobacteria bacterium]|jgi:hypothetical protein|nr:hypothetical protein [Deltaproteobacteria bacterium]